MGYSIRPFPSFERSFGKLGREIQKRITEKIEYIAEHPESAGGPMKNLPTDLRGLHKARTGIWRIFFWIDHNKKEISLYDINKRDKAYKNFY